MTDAFEAQGDFAPAQSNDSINDVETFTAIEAVAPDVADTVEAPKGPNGFIRLGLAPELIAAVEELGFTQPTAVQDHVIPRAMKAGGDANGATRFTDLMV